MTSSNILIVLATGRTDYRHPVLRVQNLGARMMSGAYVSLFNLLGMTLRGVKPALIVDARIRSVAGLALNTDQLEAHFAGGDVVTSSKPSSPPTKPTLTSLQRAAAIDLAGRRTTPCAPP